jgi:hypothetical protein
MMRRSALLAISALVVLGAAACAPSSASSVRAVYRAVPLNGEPRITFSTTSDRLLIDITSPTGIGGAAIEKTAGQWPGTIVMRLHVKGLEKFEFKYGATSIELAVSSQNNQAVHEVLTQPGKMGTVSPGDPYWIAVTPGPGYFDLQAPADFFKSGENKFTIDWIDFYR